MVRAPKLSAAGLLGVLFVSGAFEYARASGATAEARAAASQPVTAHPSEDASAPPPPAGVAAQSFGGRAVAITMRMARGKLGDYDDPVRLADTAPLPEVGGFVADAATAMNAGWLFHAGFFDGSTRGDGNATVSRAAFSDAVLFGSEAEGLLKDVLGDDEGEPMLLDLRDLLSGNGPGGDLVKHLFGEAGPLAGGLKLDFVEENARAWCDERGDAHAEAGVVLGNLVMRGQRYALSPGANRTILTLPGLRVTANAQERYTADGAAAIDAAALHIEVGNGLADVKVARASAAVRCTKPRSR